jgi:hypothetical protein
MIDRLKNRDLCDILDYIKHNRDTDFYITENNERKFFASRRDVKIMFKSICTFRSTDTKGEIDGMVFIWKSLGNNIPRYYLKITAQNEDIGQKLLKVLLWNFGHLELYVKINKQNKLLTALKIHGFKFFGDRGKEVLLKKDKFLVFKKFDAKDKADDID